MNAQMDTSMHRTTTVLPYPLHNALRGDDNMRNKEQLTMRDISLYISDVKA